MNMRLMLIIITIIYLTSNITPLGAKVEISEDLIVNLIQKSPPTIQKLKASLLQQKYNVNSFKEAFSWKLKMGGTYDKSTEYPFSEYAPVTDQATTLSVGATRPLINGMNVAANIFTGQVSNTYLSDATTSGVTVQFAMDLHKDLLGKISKTKLNLLHLFQEKESLLNKIRVHAFYQEIRKLYWNMVANNESLNVTKKLLKTSIRQSKNAKKRMADSVADSGEVARYESQVASRRASIVYFDYLMKAPQRAIKEYLPELKDELLSLLPYTLETTISNFLICTSIIKNVNHVPLEYTLYDEVINILKKQHIASDKITNSHTDWDLSLTSQVQTTGKDYEYLDSFGKLINEAKVNYSVGINFNMPLGGKVKTTRDTKRLLERLRYDSEIVAIEGKLSAYHHQVVESITLLQQVMIHQVTNSAKLAHSLKIAQKKYNQARIPVRDLINDQDALLESNLSEIKTKLMIITTLLEYFSVFTETPCELNRKIKL